MKHLAVALLVALGASSATECAELSAAAILTWEQYVNRVRALMEEREMGAKPFLWIQESPQRTSSIMRGGIAVEPAIGKGHVAAPGALTHHWIGAAFLPGASADQILAQLDRYDDYKKFFQPTVVSSMLLKRFGNQATYSMRCQKKTHLVNHAIDASYESLLYRRTTGRWWSVSRSTRVQEIEHCGRPDECLKPVGVGAGYIWRVFNVTRVQEVDGGAILELETLLLSRDIPSAVAWFVNPLVGRFSRSALATTLAQTREAVSRYRSTRESAIVSGGFQP